MMSVIKKQIKSKKERRKIINKDRNLNKTGHIDNFSFVKGSLLVLRASWYTTRSTMIM